MATHAEQLEAARRRNQARKELSFELLRDPNSDQVKELRNIIGSDPAQRFTNRHGFSFLRR